MLKDRLVSLRVRHKKTQEDMARILGVHRGTYGNYESGKRNPDYDTLIKLADYFNVPIDYLLTGEHEWVYDHLKFNGADSYDLEALREMEKHDYELFLQIRNLLAHGYNIDLSKVMTYLKDYESYKMIRYNYSSNDEKREDLLKALEINEKGYRYGPETINIPILKTIHSLNDIKRKENILDFMPVVNNYNVNDNELIMLKVNDDSMSNNRILRGDMVLVKLKQEIDYGRIMVILDNEYSSLRRAKKLSNGETILLPANDNYEPILLDKENKKVQIVGTVLKVNFEL